MNTQSVQEILGTLRSKFPNLTWEHLSPCEPLHEWEGRNPSDHYVVIKVESWEVDRSRPQFSIALPGGPVYPRLQDFAAAAQYLDQLQQLLSPIAPIAPDPRN